MYNLSIIISITLRTLRKTRVQTEVFAYLSMIIKNFNISAQWEWKLKVMINELESFLSKIGEKLFKTETFAVSFSLSLFVLQDFS